MRTITARVKPSREELAYAIAARHWDRDSGDADAWSDLTSGEQEAVIENYLAWDAADAVLALLPGKSEAEVKAEAWDEGAETAWDRSTPEVNGQNYRWRHDGLPNNPYRTDAIERGEGL